MRGRAPPSQSVEPVGVEPRLISAHFCESKVDFQAESSRRIEQKVGLVRSFIHSQKGGLAATGSLSRRANLHQRLCIPCLPLHTNHTLRAWLFERCLRHQRSCEQRRLQHHRSSPPPPAQGLVLQPKLDPLLAVDPRIHHRRLGIRTRSALQGHNIPGRERRAARIWNRPALHQGLSLDATLARHALDLLLLQTHTRRWACHVQPLPRTSSPSTTS